MSMIMNDGPGIENASAGRQATGVGVEPTEDHPFLPGLFISGRDRTALTSYQANRPAGFQLSSPKLHRCGVRRNGQRSPLPPPLTEPAVTGLIHGPANFRPFLGQEQIQGCAVAAET